MIMKNWILFYFSLLIGFMFVGIYSYFLDSYWLFIDRGELASEDGLWHWVYGVYSVLLLSAIFGSYKDSKYLVVAFIYLLVVPAVSYFSDYVSYENVKKTFYSTSRLKYSNSDLISKHLKMHNYSEVEKILLNVEMKINKGEGNEYFYENAYRTFFTDDMEVVDSIKQWNKSSNSYYSKYALGVSNLSLAWKARGHAYSSDTPELNMTNMKVFLNVSIDALNQSLLMKEDLWASYYFLLEALALMGDEDEVIRIFNRSMVKYPYSYSLRYQYYIYTLQPRWGGSLESIRLFSLDARKLAKFNPRLMAFYGYYYYYKGQFLTKNDNKKEFELYKHAIEYAPLTSWYLNLARVSHLEKNYLNEVKYRSIVIDKTGGYKTEYINRSYAYYYLDEPELAMKDAMMEVETNPDSLSGINRAAWIFYHYLDYQKAIALFNQSILIDPNDLYANRQLGDLYFITKQFDKALPMYLNAETLGDPEVKLDLLIADVMFDLKMSKAKFYIDRYFQRIDIQSPKFKKDIEVARILMKDITNAKWFVEK